MAKIHRTSGPHPTWQDAYEAGLRRLTAGAPPAEWAEVGSIAAGGLCATGDLKQAIVELEFALNSSSEDAHAVLSIQTEKIPFLIALEDFDATADALRSAREAAARGVTGTDLVRLAAYEALTDMFLLEPDVSRRAEGLVQELRRVGLEPISRLLLSWLIPYLFSQGLSGEAEPAIRSLEIAVEADQHPWRREDARFFRMASEATHELPAPFVSERDNTPNWLATWRGHELTLWSGLTRNPDGRHSSELDAIIECSASLPPPFGLQADVFSSLVNTVHGDAVEIRDHPQQVTLLNLPAVLAACEVSALGSSADSAELCDWAVQALLPHAKTSLEWPNSVPRALALLSLRSGDIAAAKRLFSEAIAFGTARDYPIDCALARLQLAELVAEADQHPARSQWEFQKRAAWKELEVLGVSPSGHAHHVTQSLAHRRSRGTADLLSRRELQVLAGFSRGLTYREVAGELGIGWRTVQSHAVSAYSKLGVKKRIDAIHRAEELGLLKGSRLD